MDNPPASSLQCCDACKCYFKSIKSLKMHWQHNINCLQYMENFRNNIIHHQQEVPPNYSCTQNDDNDVTNDYIANDELSNENIWNTGEINNELIRMRSIYETSRNRTATIDKEGFYNANVELLHILKQANTPLYLFDTILTKLGQHFP